MAEGRVLWHTIESVPIRQFLCQPYYNVTATTFFGQFAAPGKWADPEVGSAEITLEEAESEVGSAEITPEEVEPKLVLQSTF